MADFTAAITRLNNIAHNADQVFRNLFDLYYNPTELDITLEYYDESGVLQTVKIPNLAKWRNTLARSVLSMMSAAYYVDADNGSDDLGDGTVNNPFKTIRKVLSLRPHGSYTRIFVKGTHVISAARGTNFVISNRTVVIDPWPGYEDTATLIFDREGRGDLPVCVLITEKARVWIRVKNLQFLNTGGTSALIAIDAIVQSSLSIYPIDWFSTGGNTSPTKITVGDNLYVISGGQKCLHFFGVDITIPTATSRLFWAGSATLLHVGVGSVVTNGLKWGIDQIDYAQYIIGILRDANGTPRNILSNIVI